MEDFLPKDLANIVYKYIHHMNMNDVMNELTETHLQCSKYCFSCEQNKFTFNWEKCISGSCDNNICYTCYETYISEDDIICNECQYFYTSDFNTSSVYTDYSDNDFSY